MTPGRRWLLTLLAIALAAVAVRLGVWQLDRLASRREHNVALQAVRDLPELVLTDAGDLEALAPGRRVRATGRFLDDGAVLLRNRVHRSAPGVHVVSRFLVDTLGRTLWVLRGFAAAPDGVHPGAIATPVPGEVTIEGDLQPLPVTDDSGGVLVSGGDTTWQRLDSAAAALRDPAAPPFVLYLAGDVSGPGQLPAVEVPALGDGPHLSYALQWFGIALAILAFAFLIVLRRPSDRGRAPPDAAP